MRNLAIVSLALDTGFRAKELCDFGLPGLDLDNRRACVIGKGGKWRDPVFSEGTENRLRRWLAERDKVAIPGVDFVFVSVGGTKRGGGMVPTGLLYIMIGIAKDANVRHFSTQALRRSMATLSIRNGASTRLVQVQGGWSTLEMIERYTQSISPEDIAPFLATNSPCTCRIHGMGASSHDQ